MNAEQSEIWFAWADQKRISDQMACEFCIKLIILYTIDLQVVKQKGSHKIMTALILANIIFNPVNLFFKKHPESDTGAF